MHVNWLKCWSEWSKTFRWTNKKKTRNERQDPAKHMNVIDWAVLGNKCWMSAKPHRNSK